MNDTAKNQEAIEQETFTGDEVLAAIQQFLSYGEVSLNGKGHLGYYSGGGWPARVLRFHLEQLQIKPKKAGYCSCGQKYKSPEEEKSNRCDSCSLLSMCSCCDTVADLDEHGVCESCIEPFPADPYPPSGD